MISIQKKQDKLLIMMKKEQEQRTPEQLREHYEIEKALAQRLRASSPEERKALYAAIYDEFNQRIPYYAEISQKQAKQVAIMIGSPQWNFLRRFLRKETVFLEIGAGTCATSLTATRFVKKVYALEVSEEIIKNVKGPNNFEAFLFDGFSIPPLSESISVAYSDQVIEHIHPEDALEQLKSIYHALQPGGMYICITPNGLNGPHDISRYFDLIATGFHLKEYTNTELAHLFRRAGFAKVHVYIGAAGYYVRWPLFCIELYEGFL
ncbi:MAG TPA: methyltransferase domain-containing protein, partial [Ktedonobacteraceae bacterium]